MLQILTEFYENFNIIFLYIIIFAFYIFINF